MKKIILAGLFVSTLSFSFAQSTVSCTDFSINLVRGSESANVLALQKFLSAKGFLKATPNGYFGPGTLAGVKAYQKSVGLPQVGNTGPATRASIKKDSCGAVKQGTTQSPQTATGNASSTNQTATAPLATVVTIPSQVFPRPTLNSLDLVTLFAGGETDWGFNLYGTNFSTSSNIVYFKNVSSRRTYTIGTFASAIGTVIVLPKNMTGTAFPCGASCFDLLTPGLYEITVVTAGGGTEAKTIDVKSFTITSQTGAIQSALPAQGTNIKVGSLSFSSSQPVIVRSVALSIVSSDISGSGIGGITLKDDISGSVLEANKSINAFQSVIVSAYTTMNNTTPGTVSAAFIVEIEDYIGKKKTKFTSPSFLATVAGIL